MTRLAALLVLWVAATLAVAASPAAAQPEITIVHTPPTDAVLGQQVYIAAILTGATAATVEWRNSSMAADAVAPMTNLSQPDAGGWVYAAYLPAQATPTQIVYAVNASDAGGSARESYFFSVSAPTDAGLTPADQDVWVLTMIASLSAVSSTIAVLYWYTGRRIGREGR